MVWRISSQFFGTMLVLFTLRDVFRDLFHPTHSGNLSEWIATGAAFAKRIRPAMRATVGPLSLVGVIFAWVLLITLGFALIYLGSYSAITHSDSYFDSFGNRFLHSLYLSLGSFVTFETFDLNPQRGWLRLVVACEGLIGLAVITASISWTVLVYPALARARWLAGRIEVYITASRRLSSGSDIDPDVLLDFARGIIQLRIDLRLFPILLAFYPGDQSSSLASKLPSLDQLVANGGSSSVREVHSAAVQLDVALDRLSELIAENVLNRESGDLTRSEIFNRFAQLE